MIARSTISLQDIPSMSLKGLHGLVLDRPGLEPLSGHVVLFFNRDAGRHRIWNLAFEGLSRACDFRLTRDN
jgi:hypothetical protein